MKLDAFDYYLPDGCIANAPARPREAASLRAIFMGPRVAHKHDSLESITHDTRDIAYPEPEIRKSRF